ncbi:MAG: SEC-C domain-containing protein [Mariprofundaceae bacterium]|nr:SEC-C domain-containing protein [Mariprofundaceae bacterium]
MAEMLTSPLLFLSYVNRRVVYSDKLMVSHELTILSHHIKNNLWFDDDVDRIYLHDDITADLDVAMVVRRDGVPGKRSPEGLLTLHQGTPFGRLIEEIEARPDDGTIDLGFFLLTLNGKTIDTINSGIETILIRAQQDRKSHDITIMVGNAGAGLTIHCNDAPIAIAGPKLQAHCEYRKRKQEASVWFGICIEPRDASLRFGLNLNNKHKPTASPGSIKRDKNKVGRNDPCPCGSGLKYKKCCLSL